VKKYHSLAAKGEQVDVSAISKKEEPEADAESVTNDQETSHSNGVASQSIEQTQTTTGAQAARQPTVTKASAVAAQAAPVATPSTPAIGGAMPQALLNSGNSPRCSCFEKRPADDEHSAR